MPTPIEISSKRWKLHVDASMTQICDGEMAVRCVSTWQILDSNYAIVKVLFKPDANRSSKGLDAIDLCSLQVD